MKVHEKSTWNEHKQKGFSNDFVSLYPVRFRRFG